MHLSCRCLRKVKLTSPSAALPFTNLHTDLEFKHTLPSKRAARVRKKLKDQARIRKDLETGLASGRHTTKNQSWMASSNSPTQELASCLGQDVRPPTPAEKLRAALPNWLGFAAEDTVDLLRNGLEAELVAPLPPFDLGEYKLEPEEIQYLQHATSNYIREGVLRPRRRDELSNISPLFTEKKESGDRRLLVDMTFTNACTKTKEMSMHGIREAVRHVQKAMKEARAHGHGNNIVAISFDFSSAFFSMHGAVTSKRIWGTSLTNEQGERRFHSFEVAPQGHSPSPEGWSRPMRCSTKHLKERLNLDISIYCDDGIFFLPAGCDGTATANAVMNIIEQLGLTINKKKSYPNLPPSQTMDHIGFRFEIQSETLHIKAKRLAKIQATLQQLLDDPVWTPRQLQKFGGQLMSCIPVLGNLAFLWTRALNRQLGKSIDPERRGADLDDHMHKTEPVLIELRRWAIHLATDPSSSFRPRQTEMSTLVGSTDASATGLGGVLLDEADQLLISAGSLSERQRQASSTYREMLGCIHFLQSNSNLIKGKALRLIVDNRGCLSAFNFGSRTEDIQTASLLMNDLVHEIDTELHLVWVPRSRNKAADLSSRLEKYDHSDQSLSEEGFKTLIRLAGKTPMSDLYASHDNRKTKRHRSLFRGPDPQNALHSHPDDKVVYAFPPLLQINQHLRDVQDANLHGSQHSILVVLGGTAMHHTVRVQLETTKGYRRGVQRTCKIPMREIVPGPNTHRGTWTDNRLHAEAFLIGPGFTFLNA